MYPELQNVTLSELLIPLRGFSDDLWGSGYQTLSVGSKVPLLISLHNLKRGCQACFATHQTWLKFQHVCENLRLISPKEQAKECARTASNGERKYAFLSTSFTCHILAKSPNRPKASTCCASTTPTCTVGSECLSLYCPHEHYSHVYFNKSSTSHHLCGNLVFFCFGSTQISGGLKQGWACYDFFGRSCLIHGQALYK